MRRKLRGKDSLCWSEGVHIVVCCQLDGVCEGSADKGRGMYCFYEATRGKLCVSLKDAPQPLLLVATCSLRYLISEQMIRESWEIHDEL